MSQNPGTGEPTAGMNTGSDEGAPGDHLAAVPLDEDEHQLLAALQGGAGEPEPAVEDSPAMERAVEDDSSLPLPIADVAGPAADDHDDVRFHAPGDA